ncbi:partial Cation efflux system protein CusB, partial [Burkholderiales bacterium]
GSVVGIEVKAGDRVRAGQVLLRLDARAAEQSAAAADAQVAAARAALDAASREYMRQQQLFAQNFISRAALDRAEADFKAARAGAQAQIASAQAIRTQSGFFVLRAPFSGVVAELPAILGDLALPGKTLLVLYDPEQLRVASPIPQFGATRLGADSQLMIEVPASGPAAIKPARVQLMPTVDAATHTRELRLDLPAGVVGLAPGMFARIQVAGGGLGEARLFVPAKAVVRRAELVGVYVLAAQGQPRLRQVRLGQRSGDWIEVLAGLAEGEKVVADASTARY